jgi:hypothetical protein
MQISNCKVQSESESDLAICNSMLVVLVVSFPARQGHPARKGISKCKCQIAECKVNRSLTWQSAIPCWWSWR